MKKIIVILSLTYCNYSFAGSEPERGLKNNKSPQSLQKQVNRKKTKSIVFFQTNTCYSQYLQSEQYIASQAVNGFRNCQLSNEIIENFDLAACNADVNNTFQLRQASDNIVLTMCNILWYLSFI
ncbi:MAG: hypothetical protein SGI96_01550 [Bacteroidota bacterium]|nr:hypothetical protein [Bacteroidota bacterium]